MKKIEKIKQECEKIIRDCKATMFDRAKLYKSKLSKQDKENILELESTGIVCSFNSEDLESHNFDLGAIRTATEILKIIEE